MACGVGGCLGCVTSTTEKHHLHHTQAGKAQVCNNGPVFWADQVDLDKA
jgi:dihydroorotate dehydrogenase electron transfer subunit